ncbi:hypothetical protein [Nitriliruptor alkaliphilus]|uniref:hypothetical protein n=1 Tax=Nitriliruptor alkaliphilus TaxID=427918 RepID=UPI00069677CB|nr:hypothetical protein [Nitriliruptor alkaliphilus]
MDRTLRAAILAALIAFASVVGFGLLLGFPAGPTLVTGAVLAGLAMVLILAAARRAETFESPTPPRPGFPGAPDRPDGTPSDPPADDDR